jgi:arabinosaccharide transport system permease protein
MAKSLKVFLYSEKVAPYLFVSPFILAFVIFFLYPTYSAVVMSFQEVLGFSNTRFIGLDNYARLFNVHYFNALKTNTLYTALSLLLLIPIPILFSVLLDKTLVRGKSFFKAAIFIPVLTSVIVAGVSFRLMFGETDTAVINSLLIKVGLEPQQWMFNYWTGMMLMVFMHTWKTVGINMVYFLAGLQTIPNELYESAKIDGAGPVQRLFHITLPLLKPIIIYTLTIGIFEGYRMFGESYVFWNEGMPGDIGLTVVRYIYQQGFQRNDMGFGAAIGISLLLIVLIINLFQLRAFGMFKKGRD